MRYVVGISLSRCILLALVFLPACNDGSSSHEIRNLGISGDIQGGKDELLALSRGESSEHADLNGDGDTSDAVLRIYDHGTGELVETGLAIEGVDVGDDLVAIAVGESDQGGTDLNGDGDATDRVLHAYDRRTGVVTNTGFDISFLGSFSRATFGLDLVAFVVSEAAQGNADLDGDGTTSGFVLHVFDSRTRLTTNAGRTVGFEFRFDDPYFIFYASESARGDLNGDGDATDTNIPEFLDARTGTFTTVPLATMGLPLQASPSGDWYLLVSEEGQGLDLDGDGDMQDGVYHRIGPDLQTIESLGISSSGNFGSLSNGRYVTLGVSESDGIDRNGDGDVFDSYVVLHDPVQHRDFAPALAVVPDKGFVFLGDQLAVLAEEFSQDEDLNGDGDRLDRLAYLLDPVHETSTYLGFDAGRLTGAGRHLVVTRGEGDTDWNRDGDVFDPMLFVWDPLTGELDSTHVAMDDDILVASASTLVFVAGELLDKRDWNGDGDFHDQVLTLYDFGVQRTNVLGLATESVAFLTQSGAILFQVLEANQGQDLNGDGDFSDLILHVRE